MRWKAMNHLLYVLMSVVLVWMLFMTYRTTILYHNVKIPTGTVVPVWPVSGSNTSLRPLTGGWVQMASRTLFVYSAFYDDRRSTVVVLGLRRRARPEALRCQLQLADGTVVTTRGHAADISTKRWFIFTPSMFHCPVNTSRTGGAVPPPPPRSVSLTYAHQAGFPPPIPVIQQSEHQILYNFTVCLPPLHHNYSNIMQLLDTIEVSRMFGAQFFVLYDYQISGTIRPFLQYYIDIGVIEVLKWNLPFQKTDFSVEGLRLMHYNGQQVAMNDCLYRHMHTSNYIAFYDTDEIIVPRNSDSWMDMMTKSKHRPNIGAWSVRNTFFTVHGSGDNSSDSASNTANDSDTNNVRITPDREARWLGIRSLLNTKREAMIFPTPYRSKVLVRPRLVTMVGVHYVHRFLRPGVRISDMHPRVVTPGTDTYPAFIISVMSGRVALLHHYRGTREGAELVDDRTMQRYRDRVVARLQRVLHHVENE